jgi:ribokinase
VHFVTRLGVDPFADMARVTWAKAGVHPVVTDDPDSYTGAAYIFLEHGTGANAIIVAPGAAGRISVDDVRASRALIESAAVFMTQLEQPIEAAVEALRIARAAGVTTILNPAPAAELPDGMLPLCDWLTPNESEAEGLTGIPVTDLASAEAAARALLASGVGRVVVTLGGNGVLYHDGVRTLHQPVISAGPVVDTTGAGDAFSGGLSVALAEGQGVEAALRFGCATAGISVTRPGTAPAMPARAEIDSLLARIS